MIIEIKSLKGTCRMCPRRADWSVLRTNDDLDPELYVTYGSRVEYYCDEHLPDDVKPLTLEPVNHDLN